MKTEERKYTEAELIEKLKGIIISAKLLSPARERQFQALKYTTQELEDLIRITLVELQSKLKDAEELQKAHDAETFLMLQGELWSLKATTYPADKDFRERYKAEYLQKLHGKKL